MRTSHLPVALISQGTACKPQGVSLTQGFRRNLCRKGYQFVDCQRPRTITNCSVCNTRLGDTKNSQVDPNQRLSTTSTSKVRQTLIFLLLPKRIASQLISEESPHRRTRIRVVYIEGFRRTQATSFRFIHAIVSRLSELLYCSTRPEINDLPLPLPVRTVQ